MSTVSIILASLLTLTMAIMLLPSIIAVNRGRMLRNIAAWLAIVLALALIYQNFHPDKNMVVPRSLNASAPQTPEAPSTEPTVPTLSGDSQAEDGRNYTPPRED